MTVSEKLKQMYEIIDNACEGEGWWIDDNYHFEITEDGGDTYELMKNYSVLDYLTKTQLRKATREILKTGTWSVK